MFIKQVHWWGWALAFLFLPNLGFGQVHNTAHMLQRSYMSLGASPAVFMDDGVNDIAVFTYFGYGFSDRMNLNVRAGFFENSNYLGANLEWLIRSESPAVTLSTGGHYVDDPGIDVTLNSTFQVARSLDLYAGLDTDLILDDDPDLPAWIFLGGSYHLLDQVDIMAEFNFGIFEIAPHILAAGFVFTF